MWYDMRWDEMRWYYSPVPSPHNSAFLLSLFLSSSKKRVVENFIFSSWEINSSSFSCGIIVIVQGGKIVYVPTITFFCCSSDIVFMCSRIIFTQVEIPHHSSFLAIRNVHFVSFALTHCYIFPQTPMGWHHTVACLKKSFQDFSSIQAFFTLEKKVEFTIQPVA